MFKIKLKHMGSEPKNVKVWDNETKSYVDIAIQHDKSFTETRIFRDKEHFINWLVGDKKC